MKRFRSTQRCLVKVEKESYKRFENESIVKVERKIQA